MLRSVLTGRGLGRQFCFFDKQISEGYGKKCCRYGQNGEAMEEEKAKELFEGLKSFLSGWKLVEGGKKLKKCYFLEDYPKAHGFLGELHGLDFNEFKQSPSYSVRNGQILEIEVYSISLKGLSMVDFQLALRINNIPFRQYHLIELKDPHNYRKEIAKVRMAREAQKIQKQLAEDQKNWKKQKEHPESISKEPSSN